MWCPPLCRKLYLLECSTFSQGQRLKLENTVDIAGGWSLDVKGNLVINGTLSGAGTLILDGGLLGVTGSNPGFTGTVLVNSGTVEVTPQADVLGDGLLKWNLKAQGVLQSVGSIDPVLDNPLVVEVGT
jgi:hypothetical protein